jgi:hypothetical protein
MDDPVHLHNKIGKEKKKTKKRKRWHNNTLKGCAFILPGKSWN